MLQRIPAVRILPMSSREKGFRGRSLADVQGWFFLQELPCPPRNGRYRYPTAGLKAQRGTIVLFQYEAKIIARAVFEHDERFEQPENGYRGALWFDVQSIRTFDPVGRDQLRAIWPEFKNFGHVKQVLSPARYPRFERQLTNVAAPESACLA
ncbi:hypothetical protein AYO44_08080 [Planctomycetaceae bacterium SCGC AG-212-F19]|nr:hypothetical protein AYO44_08080 [Planctomycetaceae bacterium SCGC AG-212-F19]